MNKLFTPAVRITFALLGLAVILGTVVSTFNYERSAHAAYNAEINYQGKLTNGSNVAVADGTYNMEFKLYDAVSGGSLLWTETRTGGNKVQVTNGVFSVMLGEVNAFGSLDFNQTLFLSVNIGGTGSPSWDGEMSPRKKIGTVPVAFLASNLKGTGLVDITNTATQATFNYDGSNRATLGVASNGFTTLTAVGAGAGWNLTGGNVGIGTASTSAKLHVTATTEQLRVGYDAGNYSSFTTSSGGDLTIAPSGSDLAITGNVDASGTLTAGTGDAFTVNASGQVTAGTWNGTAITDTYVADTLTVDSSSSVHWNALNNYPSACSVGSAISQLADTTNTCTSFNTDTSITLQDAYDATSGNTITTTNNRNVAITLAEVASPTSFTVENQDTAATSIQRLFNSIASGTATNGLLIEQTGAGTLTNGIQIAETSGTITDGILITGTLGNILNSGTIDITGGGAITGATGVTSSGTITFSGLGGGGTQCVNVNNSGVLGVTTCGGALTPWTSDIDADGFDLNDLSNILFRETTGAPTSTDVAIYRDNSGDLSANVLTGKTLNIAVNGTDEYNFSSTGLAFNGNNITGLGTGITATAGLTITSTSANLALATSTSGDITATTATTSGIFNVLTGSLKVGAGTPGLTLNGDDAYVTGTFEVDGSTQFDGALTFNSTAGFNGVSTFNTDVDFTFAGTENLNLTNTTGSNAVDLFALTITNNDGGSATQRGLVLTNANSTSTTESLVFLDNADTSASSLTDGILITSSGVNDGIVDAIDVSASNITNALNVGANTITGAGYILTSTASGLTINSTGANLALTTTTSGNITLTPASTGSVQITSGVTTGTTTSAGLSLVANSLSSGTGVDVSSTSLTSGSLLNLLSNGTAAAANQTGLNISLQGTNGTGGITTYGAQISNAHAGATSTNVALQLAATNGTTANYALITNGGNVGIGDTTPNSLFTVGSGDLFQVNSTGQIGSQQAPVSDYLFALAGTTGNDHSRVIDIAQANDAAEDSSVLNIVNTVNPGTYTTGTVNVRNAYLSLTPTTSLSSTVSGQTTANIYNTDATMDLTNVTLGNSGSLTVRPILNVYGSKSLISGSPVLNKTAGSAISNASIYGSFNQVIPTINITALSAGSSSWSTYGDYISNSTTSAGNASLTTTTYGTYIQNASNISTTGTTKNYGAYVTTTGGATDNYGLWVDTSGATNNYAAIFNTGNVGIGTATPRRKLDILDASNPQLRLTTTDNSVYGDMQNTANANVVVSGSTLASSSAQQFGLQITPTINQTSSASYRALDVNVTETAVTTQTDLNRLADFRVASSSKLAISNDGSVTLQNAANLITPYGGIGDFQNHLVRSEEFDNASWVKTSVTAPTANTQVAPDESTSAESLATSGSGGDVCQWSGTAAGSGTFTFSVWARSTSGTQNFDLRVDAGATSCATANNVTGTAYTHTATTSWQRFTVTQTFSSATGNVKVRIFPGTTGSTGTIYAWGAQLDQASHPSNYVLTTSGALTNTNRGQVIESNFATASGFTYGGRHVTSLTGSIAASSTTVGQLIRVIDNASGTDDTATVRGLEVQSYSGSNINGINTAVAAFGYTFGVHAATTGQANESAQPAAVFADLDNGSAATYGNAIRAYTDNATSADLVSFYQESSSFTGNGLVMNFGNNSGSFSGNFLNLKAAGTTKAHIDSNGYVFASLTSSGSAALCWDGTGGTDERIQDCSGTPVADYAEMYPVVEDAEVGDIMVLGNKLVNTYDIDSRGAIDWSKVKGQINQLVKSNDGYQNTVIGVVSDNYGDFSSTGYNLKEEDNPTAIALNGRIPVKVTDENGPIKTGDYITTSDTLSGYGMKATRSGQVIGQALADFNFEDSSTGQVMVFVKVGFQSIGNTIVLDAPSINGTNLQSGNNNSLTNTASTFVIQQQTSGDESAEANILQLQTGDANRFMVSSTGSTSILSNLNCEADADSCPSVLKVTQADTELMNIDARGTLTLAGTIVIKDDTFAGSVATDEDGLAEITFSYNLGTGKPVVQLTAEAQIPVFAQIIEFKQDEQGNYTGFVMKTFDLISSPIQAIVHYNVVGKQAGYITLGEAVVPDEELEFYNSDGGDSGEGVGLIIDDGEVVGNENDQNDGGSSSDNGSVSGDFTPNNPDDTINTDDGSGSEPVSE